MKKNRAFKGLQPSRDSSRNKKKMILNELDFKREVRNINIASHNFRDDNKFYLPKIFGEYCTREIIVMEKLKGKSLKIAISNMDFDTRKKSSPSTP